MTYWVLAINSKYFSEFLKISYFFKLKVVRQLVHPPFCDHNLIPLLKCEKFKKYFVHECTTFPAAAVATSTTTSSTIVISKEKHDTE